MKTKIKYSSSLLFALVVVLSSCEKVIEFNLNDKDPRVVIEANIKNDNLPCKVKITKTVNFSESNVFPAVRGAFITLSDNVGNLDTLIETDENGIYESNNMIGVEGRTYFLTVQAEGVTYKAFSTMPAKVNFDSLTVNKQPFLGNTQYQIIPNFQDPLGLGNNYNFFLYVNGKKDLTVFTVDDSQSDGRYSTRPLFGGNEEINLGDTVKVEMQTVDQSIYKYYYSLSKNGSGPNAAAAPANPISNFSGGCLGYFSANTSQIKSLVIDK